VRVQQVLFLAMIFGLSGCGSDSTPAKSAASYNATDHYPLEICVVSGQKLGAMGEPFIIKYQGKTVKLCCSKCLKEFNSDSAKFMTVLDEAEKKAAK